MSSNRKCHFFAIFSLFEVVSTHILIEGLSKVPAFIHFILTVYALNLQIMSLFLVLFPYSCFTASVYDVDRFGRFSCAHSEFIPFSAKGCWTTKKNRITLTDAVLQRDYVGNACEVSFARVRRGTLEFRGHLVLWVHCGCAIASHSPWLSSKRCLEGVRHLRLR